MNRDLQALQMAEYMIDYNWSIRDIADNVGSSRSTVYRYITERLKFVDSEKYRQCLDIMQVHRKEKKRDRTGKFIKASERAY